MKKIVILLSMLILGISGSFAQTIMHDPINNVPIMSNWLTSIDELYANYDMIMNSITQIENQWKSIQQAIENAKGIDWENIQFDGDLDIRDEIKDANKRVNNLMSQAKAIKNTLNTTIIQTDGASYSLADLCGHGEDGKSFGDCVDEIYGYMKMNMLSAAASAVGNLSEEQSKAIWVKYGISPSNYYLIAQSTKLVREKALDCIASATDEARQLKQQERHTKLNTIVQAAMETKTSDGTIPQGALDEASLLATDMMITECMSLREAVENASAATAQKIIAEQQAEEVKASEKLNEEKSVTIINDNLPGGFTAGRAKVVE